MMKNWIFTLVTCILLTMFGVLLVLDNLGLTGERYIAAHFIRALAATGLVVYVVLALCPMVPKYKNGTGRTFLLGEIVILLVTATAQLGVMAFDIPFISEQEVFSVLAFAVWLRTFVLIVRAYLVQGKIDTISNNEKAAEEENDEKDENKKKTAVLSVTPLWKFCAYLVLGAIGVWQMVDPLIKTSAMVYCIAAASGVFAIIFAVFTVQNHQARPKKENKTAAVPEGEAVAVLPEGDAAAFAGASAPALSEDPASGETSFEHEVK